MESQPSRLTIESPSERTLAAAGVVDSHTAGQLVEQLNELGNGGDIVLNLGQVEFIDSSGLRAIVTTHQELSGHDHQLVLEQISEAVARLLEITGLHEHLHIR